MTGIIIRNATLDTDERGGLIILGIIDPKSLKDLRVDKYQREELSSAKIGMLMNAILTSRVPTIELGMRGEDVDTRGKTFTLNDNVFIVDGFQRATAALRILATNPDAKFHLSVVVHLNTTFDWERERFDKLNIGQTKISGNITLRNLRYDIPVVEHLIKLCDDKGFALCGRVSWQQNMPRGALITSVSLSKVVGHLHAHMGPGRNSDVINIAKGLDKIMNTAGRYTFLSNIKTFYEVVDKAWGVKNVAYLASANQLKLTFMLALASMFSQHTNFWEGNKLVVDDQTIRKLTQFPMTDPTVATLSSAGGGGQGAVHLGILLTEHVNRGRRTNRLVPRTYVEPVNNTEEESDGAA